jgi:hypothetical protein
MNASAQDNGTGKVAKLQILMIKELIVISIFREWWLKQKTSNN